MAENPLIGKQISLISKKNIRYLGTLYSINEQNATVALQNVRSFGTEGRPGQEVAASADVHPFLVFRGQDISDLHVHEEQQQQQEEAGATEKAKAESTTTATAANAAPAADKATAVVTPPAPAPKEPKRSAAAAPQQTAPSSGRGRGGRGNKSSSNRPPRAAPGTGASLLHRSARGAVAPQEKAALQADFDFQSNLKEFQDENDQNGHVDDEDEDEAGDEPPHSYEKDDFFDSISCEASDRQAGVDNRLRGREERDLNTETFGAVALSQRRRRGGRGGGRGRGRGGRGSGRGGRGRGRGGRGRGYYNRRDEGMPRPAQTSS